MHLEFFADDGTGRTVLQASPTQGDMTPRVDSLILDGSPLDWSIDHAAASATLLFARFTSETLSFSEPVGRPIYHAIREATGLAVDFDTSGSSMHTEHSVDPDWAQVTTLEVSLVDTISPRTPLVDCTRLGLIPGERFQGALYGVKEAMVASNAWYLTSAIDPADVLCAAGFLYSRDFLAQAIKVSTPDGTLARPSELARTLAAALGLSIS